MFETLKKIQNLNRPTTTTKTIIAQSQFQLFIEIEIEKQIEVILSNYKIIKRDRNFFSFFYKI
jgi:hypothetical protein